MGHHHHNHHRHRNQNFNPVKKKNKFLFSLKWFLIWVIIYTVLYVVLNFLLVEMVGQYDFFKVKVVYFLLIGFSFSICARIIYDLIKKKRVYMGTDVFIFWTLTYGLAIIFSEFLWSIIVKRLPTTSVIVTSPYIHILFIGLCVASLIKLVKRIEFGIRQPSQIMTGVLLIFLGILCFRFADVIFGSFWKEGMIWSGLIGFGLIIGGILMIIAWWRNNVSMFTTKHTVNWNK